MNLLPKAAWQIIMNGKDLTDKLNPLLLAATITEKSGNEADELSIDLNDKDGQTPLPPKGAIISVKMGWERGKGLPIGLVNKGTFKVNGRNSDGLKISIKAISADFAGEFSKRRNHSYKGKTLGDILQDIANRSGYTLLIDDTLRAIKSPDILRKNISDAALCRELGKKYDAVSSIKNQSLIFTKTGNPKTPKSNKILPTFQITKSQITIPYRFGDVEGDDCNGYEAEYHDKKTGQRKIISEGKDEKSTKKPQKLRKTYHNEDDAKQAAKSAAARRTRAKMALEVTLPLGRPDLSPNLTGEVNGFKDEIDAIKWRIKETTHTFTASNGLKTSISMENI